MSELKKATFGAGCFWGVESIYERLDGVKDAVSGYMGGHIDSPTYEQVCGGRTGHAEVVQLTYDPETIEYLDLLDYFFRMHDPTTPNQQGPNIGSQYRSVIFAHDEEQKRLALDFARKLDESGVFENKLITEISDADRFWAAEEYHQDFYFKRYHGQDGPICHTLRPGPLLGK